MAKRVSVLSALLLLLTPVSAWADWPQRVVDLPRKAEQLFGARYAGVWIDPSNSTQVRIGVSPLRPEDLETGQQLLQANQLLGGIVGVAYPQSKLRQANLDLAQGLMAVNRGALMGISIGEKADSNQVQMLVPSSRYITERQKAFIKAAISKYQKLLLVTEDNVSAVTLPCRGVFCDPPLRSGVLIYNKYAGCTGGFIARSRSDGKLYQFTAGHCESVWNSNWLTEFINGTAHVIGVIHNRNFNLQGDVAIVNINNPVGWRPKAWVVVRAGSGATANSVYPITSDSNGVVGIRVCVSGASGHPTSCGRITRTGVSVTYNDRNTTIGGLIQASSCAYPGDSGSPMYANHVAYAIVSGGSVYSGPCLTLAQPVSSAENLMHVNTAHDAG